MRRLILALGALLTGAIVGNTTAQAAPIIEMSVQETTGPAGPQSAVTGSSAFGALALVQVLYGDFSVITATGYGAPVLPNAQVNLLSLGITSGGTVSAATPATLVAKFTETGLTTTLDPLTLLNAFSLTLSGTGLTSANVQAFLDPNNAAYGTTVALGSDLLNGPSDSYSTTTSTLLPDPAAPFSETLIMTLTFNAPYQNLNVSAQLTPVPEPASLALLGTGLFGVGLLRRRRAR